MHFFSEDIIVHVSLFLTAAEVTRLSMTCKELHQQIIPCDSLWEQISRRNVQISGIQAKRSAKEQARVQQALNELQSVLWSKVNLDDLKLPEMEGHTACVLNEKYMAITCGWGNNSADNLIIVLDCSQLPTVKYVNTTTLNMPRFRYGFTSMTLPNRIRREIEFHRRDERYRLDRDGDEDSFITYGGCCNGGYSGDCRDLYEVTVSFTDHRRRDDKEEETSGEGKGRGELNEQRRAVASYKRLVHSDVHKSRVPYRAASESDASTASRQSTSRGYHTANLVLLSEGVTASSVSSTSCSTSSSTSPLLSSPLSRESIGSCSSSSGSAESGKCTLRSGSAQHAGPSRSANGIKNASLSSVKKRLVRPCMLVLAQY